MDKQIEELMKDMCTDYPCNRICDQYCGMYDYAERAINAGYRKIPENAVVLTKEEYEKHKGFSREEVDEISETAIKNSRKNTAEKFAEMLKDEHSGIEQDKDGEHLVIVLDEEELDEICKEITEGE